MRHLLQGRRELEVPGQPPRVAAVHVLQVAEDPALDDVKAEGGGVLPRRQPRDAVVGLRERGALN